MNSGEVIFRNESFSPDFQEKSKVVDFRFVRYQLFGGRKSKVVNIFFISKKNLERKIYLQPLIFSLQKVDTHQNGNRVPLFFPYLFFPPFLPFPGDFFPRVVF